MIVEWIPQNEYAEKHILPPKPAKNYMPEWYKKLPPFQTGSTAKIEPGQTKADVTEKLCMPLFDSFVTGYIQETWCDIFVEKNKKGVSITQANNAQPIVHERKNPNKVTPQDGYVDVHVSWFTQWEPKTPKGWSTLYTHPLNQFDFPFRTMDGIIDTDRWWIGGDLPFILKSGFEGLIPQGTPMYQMIFFKRENWKSKISNHNQGEMISLYDSVFNHFHSGYRNKKWAKKSYE